MKKLTQEQQAVVHHPLEHHARVLAVAGSGKSTTMAYRIKHLVLEYPIRPGTIQVLMFNALARKQFQAYLDKIGLMETQQPLLAGQKINDLISPIEVSSSAPNCTRSAPDFTSEPMTVE